MKDILCDIEVIDKYARVLFNLPDEFSKNEFNSLDKTKIKSTFYASLDTYNWFGFIERINECIEKPNWEQIKGFVVFYCNKQGKNAKPYIELYDYLRKIGYSSVFKTNSMNSFYSKQFDKSIILDTFYQEIISFFCSKYP
jgi:hypothetical protein